MLAPQHRHEYLRFAQLPGARIDNRHSLPGVIKEVWAPAHVDHSHYLRIYLGHLRRQRERDSARQQHLLTEFGVGYGLV